LPNPADLAVSLVRSLVELAVALHSLMKTRTVLQMENLALRYQLAVVRRTPLKRPRLKAADRLFWIGISRLCADWRPWLVIVQAGHSRWLAQDAASGVLDMEDSLRQAWAGQAFRRTSGN